MLSVRYFAILAAALQAAVLLAQPVAGGQGRGCHEADVFPSGDYTVASIPEYCTELYLGDSLLGDSGAAAVAEA